jgi:RNA polymerase sigma-70 factor (ECF subfamily)
MSSRLSTVSVDDAELVAQARQGDTAAFGELVERHRTAVYRAALAALGSHAEAEDAAQDAFLAAYRRLDSFRGASSFKTWLLTIAWHAAINRRRGVGRLWLRLVRSAGNRASARDESPAEAALASASSSDPTPEEAVASGQLMRIVQDAIRGLSPKLRDALLLAQSGEYDYREISAMLAVPVGTIKWRISEARRQVRQQLHERGYADVVERRQTRR